MRMRIRILLCAGAILLVTSAALFADDATDEYKKLMRPAAQANMALQSAAKTDLAATAKAAVDMQAAFAKIEEYWAKSNTSDAVDFAKQAQAAAKDVETAANAGDKDATAAAASKIGATCAGCHMAHRTRLPDNTFELK
jgi:hypothetical protein